MILPFLHFHQYPDHPALHQAQESYARVLSDSDATVDSSSDGSATVSVSSVLES